MLSRRRHLPKVKRVLSPQTAIRYTPKGPTFCLDGLFIPIYGVFRLQMSLTIVQHLFECKKNTNRNNNSNQKLHVSSNTRQNKKQKQNSPSISKTSSLFHFFKLKKIQLGSYIWYFPFTSSLFTSERSQISVDFPNLARLP